MNTNRFAIEPDAETDNALSLPPEVCETCGEDCDAEAYVRTSSGTYAFCCEVCYIEFVKELERGQ